MNDITVSTKETTGDFDAFDTAKPGEPIFVLQGGDPIAPTTIQFWAHQARLVARHSGMEEKDARKLLVKATAAEEVSWAMQEYQKGAEDAPDATEARARFNDEQPNPADIRKWLAPVTAGVRQLSEASASFEAAAQHLPAGQAELMLTMIAELKAMASDYQPTRSSYPNEPAFPTK